MSNGYQKFWDMTEPDRIRKNPDLVELPTHRLDLIANAVKLAQSITPENLNASWRYVNRLDIEFQLIFWVIVCQMNSPSFAWASNTPELNNWLKTNADKVL